jgi:hypothetical protein
MKVFGIGLWTLIFLLAAFVLGAKNPGWLARIPLVNKL